MTAPPGDAPPRRPRTTPRALFRIAAGAAACVLLTAHSPYRQWDVYRRTRLVIVASFDEGEAVRLGRRVAAVLARDVPRSRAMLSRARDKSDLFRLLASGQLDVALVAEPDASAAATGSRVVSNGGPLPLRALAQLGPYLLVCRAEFPAANAYQIAEALAERWPELADPATGALAGPRPAGSPRVALHPGARAYYEDHPARPAVR